MKCKYCSAELTENDGRFLCDYCGSSFFKEELLSIQDKNTAFAIKGGVLISYLGCESEVNIPQGVVSIGKAAFKHNVTIRKVIFTPTVNVIENDAFEECSNLREITNYENISIFGNNCFKASGLEKIEIGSNVVSLGSYCFSRIPYLKFVSYKPGKIIKHDHTFAFCPNLTEVDSDSNYFFPSMHIFHEVKNNAGNQRPTYQDAFVGTPYLRNIKEQLLSLYEQKICPDCGGKLNKKLFHTKCMTCGIDLNN